jgi:hypothetical protein
MGGAACLIFKRITMGEAASFIFTMDYYGRACLINKYNDVRRGGLRA